MLAQIEFPYNEINGGHTLASVSRSSQGSRIVFGHRRPAASQGAGKMELDQPNYTHEKFTESNQYWSPDSEEYAAASQLITAMRAGWRLALPRVSARQIWNSGSRPRTVYEFTLMRGSQLMIMPVLSNPYIERYIIQHDIRIIHDMVFESAVIPE